MKKKVYAILLSLAMVVTMMPAMALTAFATDENPLPEEIQVTNEEKTAAEDETSEDQENNSQNIDENAEVNEEPDSAGASLMLANNLNEGNPEPNEGINFEGDVYTCTGNVTDNSRLNIEASKTIQLNERCVLHLPKGIHVPAGASLTIKGTGTLIIDQVEAGNAGIGGDNGETCGTVIIESGTVTVTGGVNGAGIGGGNVGDGGTVEIRGGTVNATGGQYGAGIGGGSGKQRGTEGGRSGKVVISGGIVTATGGNSGAGIGGGWFGNGEDITISGGIVKATGGEQASGIGGGRMRNCGNVTITGGTVTAIGEELAAGIGGGRGYAERNDGDGGNVIIDGGNVTAIGGKRAAGIGGGWQGAGGNLTVNGGIVAATGGVNAPAIGRGEGCPNKTMGTFTLGTGLSVFDTSDAEKNVEVKEPTPDALDKLRNIVIVPDTLNIAVEPTVTRQFSYNGNEQEAVTFSGEHVTLSGTQSATNVGTYIVTATLDADCIWRDLTTAPKEYTWKIDPKNVSAPPRQDFQIVVKGSECFSDPIFYDNDTKENITGTMTYIYNGRNRSKEYIIASMANRPADSTGTIFWKFTANGKFTGTIRGSIGFRIANIKFTVGDKPADATNAVTIKDNPTYGDTWDQIVTIKSDDIKAALNGVEGKGQYTLNVSGTPNAGEQEYIVQFDGSINGIQYINVNVFTGKVNIAKADYTDVIKTASGKVKAEEDSSVVIKLPNIPKGAKYGTPVKAVENDPYDLFSIKGNRIPLLLTATPTSSDPMIFTVPVIADGNHNGYDITVTVTPEFDNDEEGGSHDSGDTDMDPSKPSPDKTDAKSITQSNISTGDSNEIVIYTVVGLMALIGTALALALKKRMNR